jgi:hypothetical protein
MTIQQQIERPLILEGLALGDDNVFDSIDGGLAKQLAVLFGYVEARFVLRIGIEEIAETRARVTMTWEVQGIRLYSFTCAGSYAAWHRMHNGLGLFFSRDKDTDEPLKMGYKIVIS